MTQPFDGAYPGGQSTQSPYSQMPQDAAPYGGHAPAPQPSYGMEPSTGIGWTIAAWFLFWPLALPAMFAMQRSSRALGAGDWATAKTEGDQAKKYGMIAMWIGIASVVLFIVFYVLMIAATVATFNEFSDMDSVS